MSSPSPAATPVSATTQATPERLLQFMWGYVPALMIEAGVHVGLFDRLQQSAATIDELAAGLALSRRGTRMLVEGLAGLALLARDAHGRYGNAPEAAAFLVSASPASLCGMMGHVSAHHLPVWMRLEEAVRSGHPPRHVNRQAEGTAFFQELASDIFPMSFQAACTLQEHLALGRAQAPVAVLDIAAGSGVWGIAAALSSPQVQVTAVDWPGMMEVLGRHARRFGVAERIHGLGGDILEVDYGGPYDLAILGHILHSEGSERSRTLLEKAAAALRPGGTIAIAEVLVAADRSGPMNGLSFALNMLVSTDRGDTYSAEEIGAWLAEAHCTDIRTLPAPGPSPIILATRAA